MQILRYTFIGEDKQVRGTFYFPLETAMNYLSQFNFQKYEEEFWGELQALASNLSEVVELPSEYRFEVICGLLLGGFLPKLEGITYTVFCPTCSRELGSSDVKREDWSYYAGPLAAGEGRKFLCAQGHELFNIQDAIS